MVRPTVECGQRRATIHIERGQRIAVAVERGQAGVVAHVERLERTVIGQAQGAA